MTDTDRGTVLIVDDEPAVAEGHAERLRDRYDCRVATDGRAGLAALDESVDVVLLDRRMPGLSGEEMLNRIRDGEYDCRVAMLTGVEPEVDVVEMGFDDYLTKPVTAERLRETVDALRHRSECDERLQRYFALASKVAVLEAEHDRAALAGDQRYAKLCEELSELRSAVDESLDGLPTRERYAVAAGEYEDAT
jgi:DNA-binding response OmpR family regulator